MVRADVRQPTSDDSGGLSCRRTRRRTFASRTLLLLVIGAAHSTCLSAASAQTYTVNVASDDGTGGTANTLSWAVLQANATGGTIDVQTDVTLTGSLREITAASAVTIQGNGHTLDGGGKQIFTVTSGTVNIQDLVVKNGVAQGGAGGTGNGGGGGGMGAGGGLYVDSAAVVSIQNVLFQNNQAIGGAGGAGDGASANGGDGGGYNANANSAAAGSGGALGGGGNGADSGYGGGGAGSGSGGTQGGAGNGGGNGGGPGVGGNGGNGMGGAVFVANGATLTVKSSTAIQSNNQAIGGAAGTGTSSNGTAGPSVGSGLYVGIGSNAVFDNSGSDITVSGNIYSNGHITVSGSGNGVVNFFGTTFNSVDSTGTTVASGILNGTTDSLQGPIANSGNVRFSQTGSGTFNGTISGVGSVTIAANGTVVFAQANSYTGGTTVSSGVLQGTTATLQGNITNNDIVYFNQNAGGTYSGNMSGAGAAYFNVTGGNTLTLSGTNSYAGGTTLFAGTLQGTTSSIQGNVFNSSLVRFNQNTTGTYSGNMTGTGGVQVVGTGTVIFTGTNSYTGGTTVSAGTLQGTTSSLQGSILNNATLIFSQNVTGTFNGTITGTGAVGVAGTGTGTVNFTSGLTIPGGVDVKSGGTLRLNTTFTTDVVVDAGGTLAGNGTINGNLTNDGTVAPGNSIGTTTVNGDYASTGTQQIEIDNAGTTAGVNNDLIVVNGNVTLTGGTVSVVTNTSVGFTSGSRYSFLQYAGTRTGTFSGATINTPFFTPTLDYGANDVAFIITRSPTSYASTAQTFNQSQFGGYLDRNSVAATGDFANVLDQVNLLSASDARSAFDQMSGAVYGSAAQLNILATTYMFVLLERNTGLEGEIGSPRPGAGPAFAAGATANAADVVYVNDSRNTPLVVPVLRAVRGGRPVWNAWTTGYGSGATQSSNLYRYGAAGNLTSVYRYLNDVVKVGAFGAYNYVGFRTTAAGQTNRTDDGQFGSYLRADDGETHVLLAQSCGFDSHHSYRTIQFGGINRTAVGSYDGWQATQYAEIGRQFPFWPFDVEPFGALQYTYVRQNGFQETGADSLNLNVGGVDANALRSLLGGRFAFDALTDAGSPLQGEFRAVWLHDYLRPSTVFNSTLAGIGGVSFAAAGLDLGRDSGLFGGGLTWSVTERFSIAGNYDALVNNQATFHVGSANAQFRW